MTQQTRIAMAAFGIVALLISACANDPGGAPTPVAPEQPSATEPAAETPQVETLSNRFPNSLGVCPFMSVSNAPSPVEGLKITDYRRTVTINSVSIATAPIAKGCLSSGFGLRNGRTHKGIDLHNADPVDIYASGAGQIREKTYRDDYGNMLVIDHGGGVFTRYAHLESFAAGLRTGDRVSAGQTIGIMGNTASYRIPRHLHYEVLTGEWGARAGSFALTPVSIFAAMSGN